MTNSDLGAKHICANCDARFYDMKQTPATCPKCGTVDEPAKPDAIVPATPHEEPVEAPAPKAAEEGQLDDDDEALLAVVEKDGDDDDDDLDEEFTDNTDDRLMEDASDLLDEEEDLTDAKEHMEPAAKE